MAVEEENYTQDLPEENDEEENTYSSITSFQNMGESQSGESFSSLSMDASPPDTKSSNPFLSTDYTDAKKLIMERHNLVIGDDDPILLMVTLLDEERRLFSKSQEHFQDRLSQITEEKHYALKNLIDDFSKKIFHEAVNSNLKNTIAKLAEETQIVAALRADLKQHRIWVGFLTSIVVVTTALLFMSQL